MTSRSLSWATALRDLKADRSIQPPIREERLRLCGSPHAPFAMSLTAWRGLSGRRYVFRVAQGDGAISLGERNVLLAVTRDARERAMILLPPIVMIGEDEAILTGLAILMRTNRAIEIHVHGLAESDMHCRAVARDLAEASAVL